MYINSVATTVLVPPNEIICRGDTVTFNCSVTLSTCGVLSWSVNNVAVGSFLDITGQVGTRASNPDFPGVVATITDVDVDANNISSSLTISYVGLNNSVVLCTDHNEQDQRELMVASQFIIAIATTACFSFYCIIFSNRPGDHCVSNPREC